MMHDEEVFQPVETFSWEVNRAERTQQARLLVPLLDQPDGRAWFLNRLRCRCTAEEAVAAEVFHLCFPLRDIFTADYYQCRGKRALEDQFIAYYNRLFGLPDDFGVEEVWCTAPGGQIRHPAAGGRAGWHESFLRARIHDEGLYARARRVGHMLRTEADVLLLTLRHVTLVECKYRGKLSAEQCERQLRMGETLARRLSKAFHFGLVVKDERDPHSVQIDAAYVRWSEVQAKLEEM